MSDPRRWELARAAPGPKPHKRFSPCDATTRPGTRQNQHDLTCDEHASRPISSGKRFRIDPNRAIPSEGPHAKHTIRNVGGVLQSLLGVPALFDGCSLALRRALERQSLPILAYFGARKPTPTSNGVRQKGAIACQIRQTIQSRTQRIQRIA